MMKYTLKNENIESYNESDTFSFPKYTSQLINWANQNAQGTRPVVVGQMSELFPEFMDSGEEITIENWRDWYVERYPDAFDKATDKIYGLFISSVFKYVSKYQYDDCHDDQYGRHGKGSCEVKCLVQQFDIEWHGVGESSEMSREN